METTREASEVVFFVPSAVAKGRDCDVFGGSSRKPYVDCMRARERERERLRKYKHYEKMTIVKENF